VLSKPVSVKPVDKGSDACAGFTAVICHFWLLIVISYEADRNNSFYTLLNQGNTFWRNRNTIKSLCTLTACSDDDFQ